MHTQEPQTVFGAVEKIDMPDFGIYDALAKIDTGAYTGALHCLHISLIKDTDGRKALQFRPLSNKHDMVVIYNYKFVQVTSASGHKSRRFIIPVQIVIKDKPYRTFIGLTKRPELKRQILIGRRFLRQHNIMVDVTKSVEQNTQSE